jgi:hypothetical protein
MFLIADKTYLISKIPLSFKDSSEVCSTCFGTGLADITKRVAYVGSPFSEKVLIQGFFYLVYLFVLCSG